MEINIILHVIVIIFQIGTAVLIYRKASPPTVCRFEKTSFHIKPNKPSNNDRRRKTKHSIVRHSDAVLWQKEVSKSNDKAD